MKMKILSLSTLAGIATMLSLWTVPALTQSGAGTGVIQGTVKAADGRPIEGVIVSARASHESWTTSVYTDRQGTYSFPALTADQFFMWAQFKGYDAAMADVSLTNGGRLTRDLTLRPLDDQRAIANQLDGPDWFTSLPEGNNQDRRMKHLIRNNCTACHPPSYVLSNRFEARGWEILIDMMPPTAREKNPTWQAYKQEFAEYLGRVTPTLQPKPLPQTMGAATRAVITEYDIPRQGRPNPRHTGTFWKDGVATAWENKAARDIWIDAKGHVWVADDETPGRTTGRLDPRTGMWTDYAFPDDEGIARTTHGIWGDPKSGLVFLGGQEDGALLVFDTQKEEFVHYAIPQSIPRAGGHIDVDSQGNGWTPVRDGALKLDAKTGTYTHYPVAFPGDVPDSNKSQYGLAIDAQDNVWIARPGAESVAYIDTKTGKTGHVRFEPLVMPGLTEKDRTVAVGMNNGPPNGRGPRRLGSGGRNGGNYMYVALNKSDEIAQIDIRTKEVKTYRLPQGSAPYFVTVDKNGDVWIPPQNADRIYKLDPKSGELREFQLPTRGTDLRHLTIDDSVSPPAIWVTYDRSNKIARLQERPAVAPQSAAR